jgi:hypothetical protein
MPLNRHREETMQQAAFGTGAMEHATASAPPPRTDPARPGQPATSFLGGLLSSFWIAVAAETGCLEAAWFASVFPPDESR